jgi:hypothetical protein
VANRVKQRGYFPQHPRNMDHDGIRRAIYSGGIKEHAQKTARLPRSPAVARTLRKRYDYFTARSFQGWQRRGFKAARLPFRLLAAAGSVRMPGRCGGLRLRQDGSRMAETRRSRWGSVHDGPARWAKGGQGAPTPTLNQKRMKHRIRRTEIIRQRQRRVIQTEFEPTPPAIMRARR